jgi:small subunit ribosomal protein S16
LSVKIRMKRAGTTNRPFYRVVVIDSRMQRDGRFIEELGYYDPIQTPQVFNVDRGKVEEWIAKGAQPSDTVRTLLKRPNNEFVAREQNREFTAGPPRPKPVRSESESAGMGGGRGGRDGGRGGRGGRDGGRGGRFGGGRSGGGRSGGGRDNADRGGAQASGGAPTETPAE